MATPDFTFIVNPSAAKGRNGRLRRILEDELRRRRIRYSLTETTGPLEATRLAREANSPIVVAVGGDGTIQEVVNGLVGTGKTLGVIPAGSGNDFIKSLKLGSTLQTNLDNLIATRRISVDLGTVSVRTADVESMRYFVNGVGIGFDAEVAIRTASVRWFRGTAVYVAAVLGTLRTYRAPDFRIIVDSHHLGGPGLLVAIGNGPCAGGGFYLTPRASVTDGLLDVCVIRSMGTFPILHLMPRVMRGAHLGLDSVRYLQGKRIEVTADRPFSVHADGEIAGRDVESVSIRVAPGELDVIAGSLEPGG